MMTTAFPPPADAWPADHEAGPGTGVRFPNGAVLRVVGGRTGPGQEHCDPNDTANPLLDTSNRALKLSANFTVGELTTSGPRRFPVARIDPKLVTCLQALRDHVGKAVVVNSGYRSWTYNRELYEGRGEKPKASRHCSGQGADIRISGLSGMEIAKAAIDACGTGIGVGIGANYAHVDVRGAWATWTYFSGARNRRALDEIQAYARAAGLPGRTTGRSSAIDIRRATAANRRYAARLGWAGVLDRIGTVIGVDPSGPGDVDLARAVARWQRSKALRVDGIIGPRTWARLRAATGSGTPAEPPTTGSSTVPRGRLRPVRRGFAGYAGPQLRDTIADLTRRGLVSVSARDVDTLQRVADVESSGLTSGVNTWDSAVVSAGFKQWTLFTGTLQDLIRRAPEAFARHGIRVEPSRTYQLKWGPQPAIVGVGDPKELRSRTWAGRFLAASLEPDAVVAAVGKGVEDIRRAERKARTVADEAGTPWSRLFEAPRGRALLVQLTNNRPGYVKRVVPSVLRRIRGRSVDEPTFRRIFIEEIVGEYQRREQGGREKALRWTRKVNR